MSLGEHLLAGAIDLHVHSAPDVITRRYTDVQIAARGADAGMRAVVLKCHHESTVGRAAAAGADQPLAILGGLVLNRHTSGGLDPVAVDTAFRMGARIVWWPTVTSAAHRRLYDGAEIQDEYDPALGTAICQAVAAAGGVLATGHASAATVEALARDASLAGARLLVTHADFEIPDLDVAAQAALARQYPEITFERTAYTYADGAPRPRPIAHALAGIRATGGATRNVLSSDLGQPELPEWPAGLGRFVDQLVDAGLDPGDAREMLHRTPARLLAL